jgi:hypothetical protein
MPSRLRRRLKSEGHVEGGTVVTALERFFLDIVGTLIPGSAALIGCILVFGADIMLLPGVHWLPPADAFGWSVFLGVAYATGGILTSLGEGLLEPLVESAWLPQVMRFVRKKNQVNTDVENSAPYKAFAKRFSAIVDSAILPEQGKVNEWRSIAMTVSRRDLPTVYRFMFLSLLNLGLATALVMLILLSLFLKLLKLLHCAGANGLPNGPTPVALGVMLILVFPLLHRRYSLYARSIRMPFAAALATLGVTEARHRQTGT